MIRETQYLMIGSGVAGGLVAEQLLKHNQGPVLMLEAGRKTPMRDRRIWLDYVMNGSLPYDPLSDLAEDYDASGSQAWRIQGGRLLACGGSTLHWGGWCPRMKPEDFQLATARGSGGLDWPWSYEEFEPYYVRAEQYLQVSGDSKSSDPPRKNNYPFEAAPFTPIDGKVMKAMDQLGISYGHMPMARNGKSINGMPACMTTGTCFYCPIGGRFTGDQPLDRLAQNPNFTLLSESPVTRLLMDGKKRVTGVEYLHKPSGKTHTIHAQKVILCAGALESPKLLLASANQWWPQGVGNDTDQVGRHLAANPYFYARAVAKGNPDSLQEEVHFATLCSRHWDRPEHQREGKFILNRAESPNAKPAQLMTQGKTAAQLRNAINGDHVMELQGALQTFSHAANRVTPAGGSTRFGLTRTHINTPVDAISTKHKAVVLNRLKTILETMGYKMLPGDGGMGVYPQRGDHAMCTCRMGDTPDKAVVDHNLKVFGVDNLHIVSNAVFPAGTAANPTLTLTALAFRFTDTLVKKA